MTIPPTQSRRTPRLPLGDNAAGSGLLLACMALLGVGVVMVYSASASVTSRDEWLGHRELRHVLYAVAALLVLALAWRVDYRFWTRGPRGVTAAGVLLAVALLLTAAVMIPGVGAKINGARRWYRLGAGEWALSFQPSELLKPAVLIFLACWLGRAGREKRRSFSRTFLPAAGLLAVSAAVVGKEDFGTAALMSLAIAALLLLARVPWWQLLTLIPPAAAGFYWLVVQVPSRWARIAAFLRPWDDTRWTYQGRQSLIAIGSGGLWGKGLGGGTLKLGFLPEDTSDFIFAVICEEMGFLGGALVLGLVAVFLILAWRVAAHSRDEVGRLLAAGLGILVGLQALLHVAVNLGVAPPTGMSLPFVSAGGTGLVVMAAAVATIISVSARSEAAASYDRFAALEGACP